MCDTLDGAAMHRIEFDTTDVGLLVEKDLRWLLLVFFEKNKAKTIIITKTEAGLDWIVWSLALAGSQRRRRYWSKRVTADGMREEVCVTWKERLYTFVFLVHLELLL